MFFSRNARQILNESAKKFAPRARCLTGPDKFTGRSIFPQVSHLANHLAKSHLLHFSSRFLTLRTLLPFHRLEVGSTRFTLDVYARYFSHAKVNVLCKQHVAIIKPILPRDTNDVLNRWRIWNTKCKKIQGRPCIFLHFAKETLQEEIPFTKYILF